jgi:chromosome segregation ATPase
MPDPVSTTNSSGGKQKEKYLIYALAVVILILGTVNLFQNRKVRELKNLRKQYEATTGNLQQLKNDYEIIRLKLDTARNNLNVTTRDLEKINSEIKTIFTHNITSLKAIRTILGTAVRDLDTTLIEMDTTVFLLKAK